MITYKETEKDVISKFETVGDSTTQTLFVKGRMATRMVDDVEEEYEPYQELIDSGIEYEPYIEPDTTKQDIKAARDLALSQITHTLDGIGVVQVRPKDLANFNLAISLGQSQDWILEDNTVATLTVEQLTECRDSGIAQGLVIWGQCTTELKSL